jgi:hypothetical protein
MLYIRFPLSLRYVEDLFRERGIEITRAWLALFAFSLGATSGHMSLVRESWVHEPFPPPLALAKAFSRSG